MKWAKNLFFFIMLCVGLTSCNSSEISVAQTKESFKIEQPTPQKSPPMSQDNNILSKDYAVAEKALNKAVLEKDKNTIRLGLKNHILTLKIKTVGAIKELNDKTFVPNLIEALRENQSIIDGGTETQGFQEELNKSIVSALRQLTKLKFPYFDDARKLDNFRDFARPDIQKVLEETQEWWKVYQRENNLQDSKNDGILSGDYNIAEKALKEAVLEKNKTTIKRGLKSQFLDIKIKTVKAIAELNDETFVPHLIKALQDNQGIIGGGSEVQVLQDSLNKTIISTLERFTTLKFKVSEPLTSENIKEVLDKTQDWCKTHNKICEKISM
jgi:hypothetical protein